MVARNNITGDKIQSKGVLTKQGEDNWDLIFGKKTRPVFTEEELMAMEVIQEKVETDWDESRIDTIGQNGNEGDHYDQVEGPESTPNKPVEPT